MKVRHLLWVLLFLTAATFLLLSLLPWLPPLTYDMWKFRLVSAEWGSWCLGLALLVSAVIGLACVRCKSRRLTLALGIMLASVLLFCLPLCEIWQLAQSLKVPLSATKFFAGEVGPDKTIKDVVYAGDLTLDVHLPGVSQWDKSLPAVVVIHGGGWNHGAKSDFYKFDRWLTCNGFAVFDINYRLAGPQSRFPAQRDDVIAAVKWVQQHASEYGADGTKIALLGRSAGAQLALLAAYFLASPAGAHAVAVSPVRAVVAFYGPTDLIWGYDNVMQPDVINARFLLENYLGGSPASAEAAYKSASPLLSVSKLCAPTLLLHGKRDHLVGFHHTELLKAALDQSGVPAEVLALPTADHAFDYNFNGWNSQIEQEVVRRFLSKYLVGNGSDPKRSSAGLEQTEANR